MRLAGTYGNIVYTPNVNQDDLFPFSTTPRWMSVKERTFADVMIYFVFFALHLNLSGKLDICERVAFDFKNFSKCGPLCEYNCPPLRYNLFFLL